LCNLPVIQDGASSPSGIVAATCRAKLCLVKYHDGFH
jgi:hypothetical protein